MTIDDLYATSSFALLAQGMKDREALDIVWSLYSGGLPGSFQNFERWCGEELREQDTRPTVAGQQCGVARAAA